MATDKEVRVNGRINAPKIRVIGADGQQVGIISLNDALRKAEEAGLDLVEISPNAVPPVCRIMDFGKYQYEESKRKHAAKRKQKQIQVKEVKFRPGTDVGDYQTKLRNLIRFLEEGDKVKLTLRFRGRELAHQELGMEMLKRLENDLKDYGVVEQYPRLEGKQMVMVLNAKPGAGKVTGKVTKSEKPAPKVDAKAEPKIKSEPKTKTAS
ncbi:MAG: translation initiation factor IF-3 [Gammaproteobacteria bacterium]|nr:translation initiation factor IF-3 [Gammaproteobacteria bacterium]